MGGSDPCDRHQPLQEKLVSSLRRRYMCMRRALQLNPVSQLPWRCIVKHRRGRTVRSRKTTIMSQEAAGISMIITDIVINLNNIHAMPTETGKNIHCRRPRKEAVTPMRRPSTQRLRHGRYASFGERLAQCARKSSMRQERSTRRPPYALMKTMMIRRHKGTQENNFQSKSNNRRHVQSSIERTRGASNNLQHQAR